MIVDGWVACRLGTNSSIASASRRIPFFGRLPVFCGRVGFFVLIIFQTVLSMKTSPCQKREAARPDIVATAKTRPAFLIMVSMTSWMSIGLVRGEPWMRIGIMSPVTGPVVALMIEKPGGGGGRLERLDRLTFW